MDILILPSLAFTFGWVFRVPAFVTLVYELMNKGPGITSNISPGTTLQMWLDAMIDKASEIESSLREGEKYTSHPQIG